ncbi:MAG TPA: cyclic nucleotide-binding domain-containing protein [Actinomycetota bacterium]|nr:cyclic nucleotide-binding domain-containing protein [Actinomycetota bacterium]
MARPDGKIEILSKIPLFEHCTPKELELIGQLTDQIDASAGEVLTREGQPGREFYVVLDGKAKVTIEGREVASLGQGDFFGEMAIIDQGPRAATVTAETPMQLYVVDHRPFWTMVQESPSVAQNVMRALAHRLRVAENAPTY